MRHFILMLMVAAIVTALAAAPAFAGIIIQGVTEPTLAFNPQPDPPGVASYPPGPTSA